jgi:hypothetical protein
MKGEKKLRDDAGDAAGRNSDITILLVNIQRIVVSLAYETQEIFE